MLSRYSPHGCEPCQPKARIPLLDQDSMSVGSEPIACGWGPSAVHVLAAPPGSEETVIWVGPFWLTTASRAPSGDSAAAAKELLPGSPGRASGVSVTAWPAGLNR